MKQIVMYMNSNTICVAFSNHNLCFLYVLQLCYVCTFLFRGSFDDRLKNRETRSQEAEQNGLLYLKTSLN